MVGATACIIILILGAAMCQLRDSLSLNTITGQRWLAFMHEGIDAFLPCCHSNLD
jgi:hypothetical protein